MEPIFGFVNRIFSQPTAPASSSDNQQQQQQQQQLCKATKLSISLAETIYDFIFCLFVGDLRLYVSGIRLACCCCCC